MLTPVKKKRGLGGEGRLPNLLSLPSLRFFSIRMFGRRRVMEILSLGILATPAAKKKTSQWVKQFWQRGTWSWLRHQQRQSSSFFSPVSLQTVTLAFSLYTLEVRRQLCAWWQAFTASSWSRQANVTFYNKRQCHTKEKHKTRLCQSKQCTFLGVGHLAFEVLETWRNSGCWAFNLWSIGNLKTDFPGHSAISCSTQGRLLVAKIWI